MVGVFHAILSPPFLILNYNDMTQNFKIGDVVFLKSDLKKYQPMTVIRIEPDMIQTAWINKRGDRLANGYPPAAIKKHE